MTSSIEDSGFGLVILLGVGVLVALTLVVLLVVSLTVG